MWRAIMTLGLWSLFGELGSLQIKQLASTITSFQKTLLIMAAQMIIGIFFLLGASSLPVLSGWLIFWFIIRTIGWILLNYYSMKAIESADRSTNVQYSILAIPFLLCTDLLMGYTSGWRQLAGAWLILVWFFRSISQRSWSKEKISYVLRSVLLSALNSLLFKYNISTYGWDANLLQGMISIAIFFSLGTYMVSTTGRKSVVYPFQKKYVLFAVCNAMGGMIGATSYNTMPPSLILAFKKIRNMIFGTLSWAVYFHEKHVRSKCINVAMLCWVILIMQAPVLIEPQRLAFASQLFKTDIAGVPAYVETAGGTQWRTSSFAENYQTYMYY